MQFRISPHSAVSPPADALERLWQQLGPSRDELTFALAGPEIRADTGEDEPVSMTRDERSEIGRRVILAVLGEVCEEAPELQADWFAVSAEE
ncbi:MAG TPA: hypothetical protein VL979_07175 [Solirubrobacteraceae bacterium]|nr:hypothetical protein [Solirubrobacteraceae bacterium]